jgi:hypothetical protein
MYYLGGCKVRATGMHDNPDEHALHQLHPFSLTSMDVQLLNVN